MSVSSKFAGIVFIALALFFSRHKLLDMFTPLRVPSGLSRLGTCLGKKMCAVVYVAPWCPACHGIEGDLRMVGNLSASNQDFGVLIIVGAGQSPKENEDKARELGVAAVTDNERTFSQGLRIRKYPSFFVVSTANQVLHKDEAALRWMDETLGFSR
jgi:hypothetical protein